MKNKKKDETVDITTLPKINIVTSSLILDFKNSDRRFKLLENMFKQSEKALKLITREQLVEFAKENKIYIDPEEGKKPNPKDPPVDKREINSIELAKAANGIIQDRAIPIMKEKKSLIERIEDLKKQKEEAIFIRDNPQPVDPKNKAKTDKKKEIINPDEIVIPTIDEMNTDMIIVFFNYPNTEEEYLALESEKVVINNVKLVKETDELIEEAKEEVTLDKNGKPIKVAAVKDQKPSNELLQMQKYFLFDLEAEFIYNNLVKSKLYSDKYSLLRLTYFETFNFSYSANEETKKDSLMTFTDDYYTRMNQINRGYLDYLKWLVTTVFQKVIIESLDNSSPLKNIQQLISRSGVKLQDLEHINNTTLLFSYCVELLNWQRLNNLNKESNQLVYEHNEIDTLFENVEKELNYEFLANNNNNYLNNEPLSYNSSTDNIHKAASHLEVAYSREEQNVERAMSQCDSLSSPFKLIIDENDLILKSTMRNTLEGGSLSDREKTLNLFRLFPGIGRHGMPLISPVEENRRKAMKCEIYPFLGEVDIFDYEKYLLLAKFEQILQEKVPEHKFNFGDRIYQEIMNKDILTQTLNNALMYDTECLTFYNERDDNLLLATYYRCPKGRIYRKTNKSRYLSKPDFENWVKYFRPTINQIVDKESKDFSNSNPINNLPGGIGSPLQGPNPGPNVIPSVEKKSTFVKKPTIKSKSISIPNPSNDLESQIFYDVDDTCLGEVTEKIKYMFPSDNGVFVRKQIKNGIFSSHSSYVRKDNLTFGVRENSSGVAEFWLRFENDILLVCNYIGEYNPFVRGKETEPQEDLKNGTYTTISYKNGLTVQVMPDGDICQKIYTSESNEVPLSNVESHRIISSKASVIKHFPLDKTMIMYSNGNVCNIQNGLAVNTNNKGNRIAKRIEDSTMFEMDPVPITIQTDPESNTRTLIRDDKVVNITYPDDSSLTIHADDTKIYTYPDKIKSLIEHENFATVEIQCDPVKKRTKTCVSDSDSLLGSEDLMTRSYDGRLSRVALPDRTVLVTIREKRTTDEFDVFSFNTVTMVYRPDGTVIRVQQDGDICIVTSEERQLMNLKGQNLEFGVDSDYLFEVNGRADERKRGTYTVNMQKKKIWTRDDEGNVFEIHADGTAKSKIKVTLDLANSQVPIEDMRPSTPIYETIDYIEDEVKFSDPPSNFFPPRLFVINNDNSGYELLSESQIANFKLNKLKDPLHACYYSESIENLTSHYWLTKYESVNALIAETHLVNKIKIPKKLQKITETPVTVKFPPQEIYLYRNLIQSREIDDDFRERVNAALVSKDQWFSKRKVDFGVMDRKIHLEEIEDNSRIQKRILQERQTPDTHFDYNQLQNNLGDLLYDKFINEGSNSSLLFNIEDFIEEKEKGKLIEDKSFRILPMNLEMPKRMQDFLEPIEEINHKRKSVTLKKRRSIAFENATEEIKFTKKFHNSEWSKNNFYSRSDNTRSLARKKEKNNDSSNGYPQANDDLNEDEANPNGLEAILSRMASKSIYEETLDTDSKHMSPIVYLQEDTTKKFSPFDPKNSPRRKLLPSIYKMKLEKIKEIKEKERKDADNWIDIKNQKFSHDGSNLRKSNPYVPGYLKTTFPEAEFNEEYIYMEKLTDKRLKTSSVSKRLYFNAPSVNDIRKSGQHNFLVDALHKKQTYEEMMERLNLMITSELCDPLNKMLKIEPSQLDFGYLKLGMKYQMFIKIRNDDNMTNRVQVAPGEIKKVKISLQADNESIGKINEVILIQTKSFIYKIPVSAVVLAPEDFEKMNAERMNKGSSRLPCYAEIYRRETPPHEKIVLTERQKEEYKIKNLSAAFDPSPYLRYLEKNDNSIGDVSVVETQSSKLPKLGA